MASFTFGLITGPYGEKVYVDSFSVMYQNAKISGNDDLVRVLEHRIKAHDSGPCYCEAEREESKS